MGGVATGAKRYATDENGQVVMDLWPNENQLSQSYYTVTAYHPRTRVMLHNNVPFQVAAQADDVWNRIEILAATSKFKKTSSKDVSAVVQASIDAITARDSLQASLADVLSRYLGPLSADPSGASPGTMYFNTTLGRLQVFDGVIWGDVGADMFRSIYDPQEIAGDAFDRGSHTGLQLANTIADLDTAIAANVGVVANTNKNSYPPADQAKLATVQAGAQVNLSPIQLRTALAGLANTNILDDALLAKLGGISAGAEKNPSSGQLRLLLEQTNDTNILTDALLAKLDSIEASAQRNFTAAELKLTYESNPNTNAFTDGDRTKLASLVLSALLPPGGNAMQTLQKVSGQDFDFIWADPAAGGTSANTTSFAPGTLGAVNVQGAIEELESVKADLAYVQSLAAVLSQACLLYTSPSPRDATLSRLPSSA